MDIDQNGADPIPAPADTDQDTPPETAAEEWVLQADAARIAGCSVSAVRKWRREGVVEDRLTTTIGGMERVEVRLADVLDRGMPRPGARRPVAERALAPSTPGTVVIPLGDLQALFAQVGEAQQRAADATERAAQVDVENRRLTGQLARTEAGLAKALADLEDERRRARQRDSADPRPAAPAADNGDSRYLRTELARTEARLTEARSEISGQRRRIRELEGRAADGPGRAAAERAVEALQAQVARAEHRTARMRHELEEQRRRVLELESIVPVYDDLPAEDAPAVAAWPPVAEAEPLPPAFDQQVYDGFPPEPEASDPCPSEPEDRSTQEDGGARPARSARPSSPLKPALQRLLGPRAGSAATSEPSSPGGDAEQVADDLRHLYSLLQNRSRSGPDDADGKRWVADLAAYDTALVRACREFGVRTRFRPGDRLPVEDRVALSRALAEAGLDVRARATG